MGNKQPHDDKAVEQDKLENKSDDPATEAEETQPAEGDEPDAGVEADVEVDAEEVDEEAAAHEQAKADQFEQTTQLAVAGGDTSKSHRRAVERGETTILPYEQAKDE